MQVADLPVGDGVVDGIGVLLQIAAVGLRQPLAAQLPNHVGGHALDHVGLGGGQAGVVVGGQQVLQQLRQQGQPGQ